MGKSGTNLLVQNNIPYVMGNVYRLPKELLPEFHTFMESLQVNRNLCADFNLDLLKINTKIHYNIMDKPNVDANTDPISNFECFMKLLYL